MTITVLDGFTANPGDLSWQHLEKLGTCQIYSRTPDDQIIERARNSEIILTNKTLLDETIISQLPSLKYIGVLATGYNVVDIDAARKHGVTVTNVPAYSTKSVAQSVFAHILNLTNHVMLHANSVKAGDWCKAEDFCYWHAPLLELAGRTIGIIGYGLIGHEVAKLALAFDMKVLVYTRTRKDTDLPINYVDLDSLLAESDIVTLHCPLTPETENLINAECLNAMKDSAFLINTGRGPLLDEAALANALKNGHIAGAGLDVLASEPPSADNPLINAPNCYITPHISWATQAARQRLLDTAIDNVKAFQKGTPINVVS